jgi:thiopeptide-type bacteriocin biosynthesis protein
VEEFVAELIESSALAPVSYPSLTSDDPAADLVEFLYANRRDRRATKLGSILARLRVIDQRRVRVSAQEYDDIAGLLRELVEAPELSSSQLFHVDLVRPVDSLSLSRRVVAEIGTALKTLAEIAPQPEDDFREFKRAFVERFEDAEVPLLMVLDPDSGISFGDPDALDEPDRNRPLFTRRDEILLTILSRCELRPGGELCLTAEDVSVLRFNDCLPLLDSFTVFTTVFAQSADAVDRGEYSFAINGYQPTIAIFGRFATVDQSLRNHLREVAATEDTYNPDAVIADILHHPAGEELGNILRRPNIRRYEIPLLGSSSMPPGFQIRPDDLLVSVKDGRVVLRSRSLNKEVLPRLGNAHSYRNPRNLRIYKFLCALQSQGRLTSIVWDWGPVLNSLPHLPRLRYDKLILSPARWVLGTKELQRLVSHRTASEKFVAMTALAREKGLPRYVLLQDADQRLPVDLHNIMSVNSVLRLLKGRTSAVFIELLGTPGYLCTEGPDGRFQHELKIPFVRGKVEVQQQRVRPKTARQLECQSRFAPGSEWVYLKIYGGPRFLEEMLLENICPAIEQMEAESLLQRWFFVRYFDGNHHLRLRLRGETAKEASEIMARITSAISMQIKSLDCWRIQADTYIREIDRYGGPEAIQYVEELFFADSKAVVAALARTTDRTSLDERLLLGIAGINQFLCDLQLTIDCKVEFSRELAAFLRHDWDGKTPANSAAISGRWRNMRPAIDGLMRVDSENQFSGRSMGLKSVIKEMTRLESTGKLSRSLVDIFKSITHMHINRMFQYNQRFHEYIAYEMLFKSYRSIKARSMHTDDVVEMSI